MFIQLFEVKLDGVLMLCSAVERYYTLTTHEVLLSNSIFFRISLNREVVELQWLRLSLSACKIKMYKRWP